MKQLCAEPVVSVATCRQFLVTLAGKPPFRKHY
jgi:hypothetical protein